MASFCATYNISAVKSSYLNQTALRVFAQNALKMPFLSSFSYTRTVQQGSTSNMTPV